MIEQNLRPLIGNEYRYKKNSTDIYVLLKEYGSIENAIRNATRLAKDFDGREDYSNLNPGTMVRKLVEELFNLK